MANPFQDKQNTTGGKAGFASFNELTSDKAYDDETLSDNPGAPLPIPVPNPPEEFIQGRQVTKPDYEGIQLQKFKDIKKTCEAMDDILEREYIDIINSKKTQIGSSQDLIVESIDWGKVVKIKSGTASNIDVVRAGSSTSISNIITEINDLRSSLRVRIGPPQVNNNAGINTLRSSKLQDELAVWYDEAGNRTTNISDFQGGIDALTGLASSISQYNG